MQQQTIETLRQALQESALPFGIPYHFPNRRPGGILVYAEKRKSAAPYAGALPGKRCAHLPFGQRLQHAVCR